MGEVATLHSVEGYTHELKVAFVEGQKDAKKKQKDQSYLDHADEDLMRAYLVGWRVGMADLEAA